MPELDLVTVTAAGGRDLLAAAERDWLRPVPHCPGWNAADLVGHTGAILGWIAKIIATGERVAGRDRETPPAGPAALDCTLDVLTATPADSPAWTFSSRGERRAGWWRRRLAVELAIHRWDAQHAAGLGGAAPARPLDAAVAAAGIEEFLTEFLPGLLAQPEVGGLTGTLDLHATDGPSQWRVDLDAHAETAARLPLDLGSAVDVAPSALNLVFDVRKRAVGWSDGVYLGGGLNFLRRRLPPCQSSWMPVWPGLTPKLCSWGRSRRLRLSSAKPGKEASPTTWSHSRIASWSLGSRLMTGPKNAVPSGGPKWMIGVPTSLPVSASASSVSARSSPSQLASSRASASATGNPARLSSGSTNSRLPRSSGPSAGTAAESNAWVPIASYRGPTAWRPCSARVRAATRSSRSPAVWPAS